jgi:hypothetical protein
MLISERHEPLLQFPRLPQTVAARYSDSTFALRPFGLYESDLNVDFSHPLRPFLVTEVLQCCTRNTQTGRVEQSFLWDLPVGKRIECLLTLLSSGAGSDLPVAFHCPERDCREESEVEISVANIVALQTQAYEAEHLRVQFGDATLVLRRPTATDQLDWCKARLSDQTAAINSMLQTLLVEDAAAALDGQANLSEWLPTVEEAMDEFDPLINFSLLVNCCACGAANLLEVDLEEFSLRSLRQAQMRLLACVHSLARHYHWSEQEIFSVPYWRRTHYLSLIEEDRQ